MAIPSAPISRRQFLGSSALLVSTLHGEDALREQIIDIHQHTNYSGRTHKQLRAHQKAMGVTTTVLLPAGSRFGLDCNCGGNQSVFELAGEYPEEFVFFANEVPDLPEAKTAIEKYLHLGAVGIGEQKFRVPCDSQPIELMAEIAQDLKVPVLLHFQHGVYNTGIENFHRLLKKFPKVNFIGHAQTWWGNVDKSHDQTKYYPVGQVTPGGITDTLLREYPNMYGDLSAGSGLNFLLRDEGHARDFLERHHRQLMFGSDCNDPFGRGPACQGAQTLAAIRRLIPAAELRRNMLYGNAKTLLKL